MVEQHHECCVKVAEKQGSQEKQGTNSNLKCDAGVHKDLLNGQGHLNALYVLNIHKKSTFQQTIFLCKFPRKEIHDVPRSEVGRHEILHRRIFRLKLLHRQFHLILTVLVIKHKKMSENGEI